MNTTKYLKGECSECHGHIEFPAEAAGTVTECPHCGKPTELLLAMPPEEPSVGRKALVWLMIALLISGLGLAGALAALKLAQKRVAAQKEQAEATALAAAAAAKEAKAAAQAVEDPSVKAGFQVSAIRLEKTPGTSVVHAIGTLTNATTRQRFGVRIKIDIFDAAGQKLETAADYQSVLEPNGEWQFTAPVIESKARSAKLAAIKEDQ
jgi:hypothetical protein